MSGVRLLSAGTLVSGEIMGSVLAVTALGLVRSWAARRPGVLAVTAVGRCGDRIANTGTLDSIFRHLGTRLAPDPNLCMMPLLLPLAHPTDFDATVPLTSCTVAVAMTVPQAPQDLLLTLELLLVESLPL